MKFNFLYEMEFINQISINKRITMPLIVFFKNKFETLLQEHNFAWQKISKLHLNDKKY